MNEIVAKLGEIGLPEGRSVLVLERRERLGGAATLERPFSDAGSVIALNGRNAASAVLADQGAAVASA